MASKLFSRLGGRQKKFIPAPPLVDYPHNQTADISAELEQVEIEDDFSLPIDEDEDADLYSEPIDSLDASQPSILVKSISADNSACVTQTDQSDPSIYYSTPADEDDGQKTPQPEPEDTEAEIISQTEGQPTHLPENQHQTRISNNTPTAEVELTADGQTQVCDTTAETPDNSNKTVEDTESNMAMAGIYMNDTSLQFHTNNTMESIVTPDADPRNMVTGDEYECPWDIRNAEDEIYELMKEHAKPKEIQAHPSLVKMDYSQSGSLSSRLKHSGSNVSQQSVKSNHSGSPASIHSSPDERLQSAVTRKLSSSSQRSGDGSSSGERIKQRTPHSNVRRQSSTSSSGKQSNAVLVEGEWREAKHMSHEHSPPVIMSSRSCKGHNQQGIENAASNLLYEDNHDNEITLQLRYPADDKSKSPRAAPRNSLRRPTTADESGIYENALELSTPTPTLSHTTNTSQPIRTTKPMQQKESNLYEAPWNSDQIQQELIEKIGQQKVNSQSLSKQRKKSGSPVHHDTCHLHSREPSRHTGTNPKIDKLSPRALPDTHIHKPNSVPPLPRGGPGQQHANKPVSTINRDTVGSKHSVSSRTVVTEQPVLVKNYNLPTEHKLQGKKYITETTYLSSRSQSYRIPGHMMMESSVSDIGSVSSEGTFCKHRHGLNVSKSLPLKQQPWYHGAITRNYAEELLTRHPDGSFLVRDSTGGIDQTLSLKHISAFRKYDPFRNASGFIHIKIVRQHDGTFILGQFSNPFKNIAEMVEFYSRHKVNIKGAEHTYLEIPVMKTL